MISELKDKKTKIEQKIENLKKQIKLDAEEEFKKFDHNLEQLEYQKETILENKENINQSINSLEIKK